MSQIYQIHLLSYKSFEFKDQFRLTEIWCDHSFGYSLFNQYLNNSVNDRVKVYARFWYSRFYFWKHSPRVVINFILPMHLALENVARVPRILPLGPHLGCSNWMVCTWRPREETWRESRRSSLTKLRVTVRSIDRLRRHNEMRFPGRSKHKRDCSSRNDCLYSRKRFTDVKRRCPTRIRFDHPRSLSSTCSLLSNARPITLSPGCLSR